MDLERLGLNMAGFDPLPHVVALMIAYVLALPIGWHREKADRSAGLRTFPLVALASCGFVRAGLDFAGDNPEALARIVEGVIAGMGFIGGGAILKHGANVRGTATAASLWVTGAIGVATGVGALDVALVLSGAALLTLWVLSPLKVHPETRG